MTTLAEHPVVCWAEPGQIPLVREICRAGRLEVIAAGSPQAERSAEVAEGLGAKVRRLDDIRAALTNPEAAAVLLASPGDFGQGFSAANPREEDAGVLADCRARGVPVFTLEPIPAGLLQLDASALSGVDAEPLIVLSQSAEAGLGAAPLSGTPGLLPTFCPLARLSKPVREAAELFEQVGPIHSVLVESWCGPIHGSLGARVYDAVDLLVSLLGVPDRTDAAYVGVGRARGARSTPGDSLRGLSGDLTANLRFPDGRAGCIVASNRAGRFSRVITVVGENGRLRIYDDGLAWIGVDGRTIDASRDPARIRGSGDEPGVHAIIAIAEQVARALDPAVPAAAPSDPVRLLATCGAILLSARTGQSESPETMLRMARTG